MVPDADPDLSDECRWLRAAGALAAGIALVVVAGWLSQTLRWVTFLPRGAPMVMPAALGVLLCAGGVLAVAEKRLTLAGILGGLAVALGVAGLTEHFVGHSIGFDWLLHSQPFAGVVSFMPLRIAANSAVALVLIGAWLMLRAFGHREHWLLPLVGGVLVGGAAVAAGVLPLLGGVGSGYVGIPLPTSLSFFALGAGIVGGNWFGAGERRARQLMAAGFGMLLSIGVTATQSNGEMVGANQAVRLGYQRLRDIDYLVAEVARMESSARAYGLTGDESFNARDQYHIAEVRKTLTHLSALMEGEVEQRGQIERLRALTEEKFSQVAALELARKAGGAEAAGRYLRSLPTKTTSALVALTAEMKTEETKRFDELEEVRARVERSARLILIVGSLTAVALIGVALALSRRSSAARETAEQELRVSNRLLRATLDGTVFSVIATKPDGTIEVFNSGAEKMLGYAREEVIGRATPELIHVAEEIEQRATELAAEVGRAITPGFETFAALARMGRGAEREWTYVRKDGTRFPVQLSVTVMRDERGSVTGYLGVALDLTARHQAAAQLIQSQRLLTAVTGIMPGMLAYWTTDLRCAFANGGYQQWFSRTAAQMHDIQMSELLGEELFRKNEPYIRGVLAGKVQQFERELTNVAGEVRHTWAQYVPDFEPDSNRVRGFVVLVSDISEVKRQQEELRQKDRALSRLATIVESADVAILSLSLDSRIETWNPAAERLFGYRADEIVGSSIYRLIPAELHAEETSVLEQLRRGERLDDHETVRVRKDGSRVDVALTISPIRDQHGEVIGMAKIAQDIGVRKQTERNLAVARDEALAASRLKSEFLATMSHEIRTPMNAIIGMAGLLVDTPLSSEQAEMARTLAGGAESLLAIINDILDFSRIEAGQLRLDPAEFDLRQVVEETAALLASRAHAKGLELVCEFKPAPDCKVLGDAGRVRQVLMNLIGNAVKFTDAGEVAVEVGVVWEHHTSLRVRLTVRDTGIGIPTEARDRLFKPFMQVDGSNTRRFGGTGLGLAITRQLVAAMGGEIGFDSEPGRGSTFRVELEFPRRGKLETRADAARLAGRRVLVVDDNATNRAIVLGQLAHFGGYGDAVADGPAALARLRDPAAPPWDLVLLDWQMPGMDGLELAMEIRADRRLDGLPLVMLSSAGSRAELSTAGAVGFAAFLSKPVTEVNLARCLSRVLAESDEAARAESPRVEPPAGGARLHVLLAEDNLANQRVAMMLLTKLGHTVVLAENGQQTLDRLARGKFDVLLLDCQMPVMDGYEVTRRIRGGTVAGVRSRIPIIALTAYARAEDRTRCLEAGMDAYVSKPIRVAELQAALEACGLDRLKPAAPVAPIAPESSELFDAEVVASLRSLPGQNGPSLWPELVELYLSNDWERLEQMERSSHAQQSEALAQAAHIFAGSAASIGARYVRSAAMEIEKAARAGNWSDVTTRLAQLRGACALLRREIARRKLTE